MRPGLLLLFIASLLACFETGTLAALAFWDDPRPLSGEEVFVLTAGGVHREPAGALKRPGFLVVDLSDGWVPFIFSDRDGPQSEIKPNPYRETFIALADDRVTPDELFLESPAGRAAVLSTVPAALRSTNPKVLSPDEQRALERARRSLLAVRTPNFLEVYGIPPTLSVLARRVEADGHKSCFGIQDPEGLRRLDFEISYQSHEQARAESAEAMEDAARMAERLSALGQDAIRLTPDEVVARLAADPHIDATRLERYRRGQARVRAVGAVQQRLVCEGLLSPEGFTPGVFDLSTHRALAEFERKNDIFGWGFVSGETKAALLRSPLELHFETFRRILAERIADAAGILEDGSVSKGPRPATYVNAVGNVRPVPDVVGDFVDALLHALRATTPQEMAGLLRAMGPQGLAVMRVAFEPPPLPPYYGPVMNLSAEIDRGDVWYDVPLDANGKPVVQPRKRFPTFRLFVTWRTQKIPLVRWRTTIGSWRSELGSDGRVYLKYKNSDVGPRIWKNIVAAPAWIPPEGTPGRDLLTRKAFDRRLGPVSVVNTEVMGPGFASAYGLVMAIHLKQFKDGRLFDNGIRTHGAADYTSIARRFSHGCHRLVNNRAVRLFDFMLRHRTFARLGDRRLGGFKRSFLSGGREYEYRLTTRGYYFELRPPVPVVVLEGRILGAAKAPMEQFLPKPGVDYGPLPADSLVESRPVVRP
ncbi:MAG TPA: L,D-transpeptidase [Candidatus Methylomirabilis sp.]|nr:L,D-transpeptidase [Candidatus Methylomirabilis sp.]